MEMLVSADGEVMLPVRLREELGIRAGDLLGVTVERENGSQRIVLTPQQPQKQYELQIIADPETGWPVLSAGPGAPVMTNEDVAALLVDFP